MREIYEQNYTNLEYFRIEYYHDEARDVERSKRRVDDKVWIIKCADKGFLRPACKERRV